MARRHTDEQIAQVLYTQGVTNADAAKQFGVVERTIRHWWFGDKRAGIKRELDRLAAVERQQVDSLLAKYRRMAVQRTMKALLSVDDDRIAIKAAEVILGENDRACSKRSKLEITGPAGGTIEVGSIRAGVRALIEDEALAEQAECLAVRLREAGSGRNGSVRSSVVNHVSGDD